MENKEIELIKEWKSYAKEKGIDEGNFFAFKVFMDLKSDHRMTFSEQCLFVRRKLGLTQPELAKAIGVGAANIPRWELYGIAPRAKSYGKFMNYCEGRGIKFDADTGRLLNN